MSEQSNVLFNNAELALAAYATLVTGPTDDQRGALQDAAGGGMSPTQALAFAARYPTVVTSFSDPVTGLQVTVFKDTAGDLPGNLSVAFRGTTIPEDLPTGANIVASGAGYQQIVAMFNWWQRATSFEGELVAQYQIVPRAITEQPPTNAIFLYPGAGVLFYLEPATDVEATGFLLPALARDPDGKVDLTGHSLGGHLAMAFSSLFATYAGQVTVFNAPGFSSTSTNQSFFDALGGVVPSGASITNVAADESLVDSRPFNFFAGMHSRPGIQINVAIERQANSDEPNPFTPALNHSIVALTDSLAVFDLLSTLTPSITTSDYRAILAAAVSGTAASYERIVDALETLIGTDSQPMPFGNNQRDGLYSAMAALRAAIDDHALFGTVSILPLTTVDAAGLVQGANGLPDAAPEVALAYRYALKELNPFIVTGNAGLYTLHNLSGELDLYDPAAGLGMSRPYLAARAEMLNWLIKRNTADGNIALRSVQVETRLYENKKNATETDISLRVVGSQPQSINIPAKTVFGSAEGEEIIGGDVLVGDRLFGAGGNDILIGYGGNDYLEGGAGADVLQGGFDRDTLMGDAGDDTLEGGRDSDTLNGGPGFDTYRYFSGNGPDVIVDFDGQGRIEYDGIELEGGARAGDNFWQTEDKKFAFSLSTEADGTDTLSISGPGGTLFVRNFVNGQLGITLEDAPAPTPTPPAGGREILGIYAPQVFENPPDLNNPPAGYSYSPIPSTEDPNDYVLFDDLGNLVRDPTRPWLDNPQTLYGSEVGDHIVGSDYGNGMAGLGGDDYIQGGLSIDGAQGGEGNDFIEGGAFANAPLEHWLNVSLPLPEGEINGISDDILRGGPGNDVIFGGTAADLEALLDPATPSAGHKGDWLAGERGDDQLYGSTGDDVLLGGGGKDTLVGGPGDDVLDGDDSFYTHHATIGAAAGMWRIDVGSSPFDIRFVPVPVMPWLNWSESYYKLAGDDDVLFGGTGNDILIGMSGNDMLLGEDGRDSLSGWEGDDTLLGGEGDDVMAGDFGVYERPDDRLVGLTHSVPAGFLDVNTGTSGPVDLAGNDYLDGGNGNDILYGEAGEDIVIGGAGNDELWGDASYLPIGLHASDYLDGGAGDDVLHGGGRDDILLGGAGSDLLDGGDGGDTYVFARDDGDDVIDEQGVGGIDTLILRDYAQADVTVSRLANGTVRIFGENGDTITLSRAPSSAAPGVESIRFADGTSIDVAALANQPLDPATLGGAGWETYSDGADTIDTSTLPVDASGFVMVDAGAGNDTVYGGSNAIIYGNVGDDTLLNGGTLIGGEGNDFLSGGVFADGGAGNDAVSSAQVAAGGPGDDFVLDVGRYLVLPQDSGRDTLHNSFGLNQFGLADWYYNSIGIPDWRSRLGNSDEGFISIDEGIALGLLPPLPQMAANDWSLLEPLYEAGLIQMDTLEIGPGITLGDLALSWEQISLSHPGIGDFGPYVALNIGIAPDNVVSLVIPHSDDLLGAGFEEIQFADGSVTRIEDLVSLAPPAPSFDPHVPGLVLEGTPDDDVLIGALGPDTLAGRAGNDLLQGGRGDDTYVFNIGDGVDSITDARGLDTVSFGAGITLEMLSLGLGSLLIRVGDTGDAIHIEGLDPSDVLGSGVVEVFQFATGVNLTYGALIARGFDISGTAGDDVLTGTNVTDRINGLAGNDVLLGSEGSDTYVFGAGAGQDLIREATALGDTDTLQILANPADVTFTREADDFVVSLNGTPDRVAIESFVDPTARVERAVFADGTTLSFAQMLARVSPDLLPTIIGTEDADVLTGTADGERILGLGGDDYVQGLEGDDRLEGGAGSDTLEGNDGNDTLVGELGMDFPQGGVGDDTYVFEAGDGIDFVFDEGGYDLVRFGAGIMPQDVRVTNDPYGTLYLFPGLGNDRLALFDWFNDPGRQIENVDFADATIWDAAALSSRVATLSATEFSDVLTQSGANDTVDGLGGNDEIYGMGGDDVLAGGVGDDYLEGGAGSDVLRGGDGTDGATDWQGNNFLDGGAGDDNLWADGRPNFPDGGANFVVGGAGNDWVNSYAAGNVIAFSAGDGQDTVYAANALTLSLGGGLTPAALSLSQDGIDLVLAIGAADSIRLTRQFEPDPQAWPHITLQMFGSVHLYDFNAVIADFRAALAADPSLTAFPLDGVLQAHETSVSETDALGGALAYQYGTAGNFNALSDAAIRQVLAEANFGAAPQSIAVPGGNQAPVVAVSIADQSAQEDSSFSFAIPAGTFSDAGDTLTLSASLADGSVLPAWLAFDAATRSFSGTPSNGDVGTLSVKVTATDSGGLSAFDNFDVMVANTNDAPVVLNAIADQAATEDSAFAFTVPVSTFADVDVDDTLTYSASRADGSALPAWLAFDGVSRTFSGTPANEDVGTVGVKVTATDRANASVSDVFDLTVANTNDAPVLANAIAEQAATEDTVFSFTVPANAFADVDVGDTLVLSATRADGTALPSWLTLDAMTRSFSGTPLNADVGTISVRVTATDGSNASASDVFDLAVANTNDAPVAVADSVAVNEDATTANFVPLLLANDTDVDAGDTRSITAVDTIGTVGTVAFDAANQILTYAADVTAQDALGDGATAVDAFAYTVTDAAGASSTATATVTVTGVNDLPILANAIADQSATEDSAFSFTLPADTFADVDAGDTLVLSATRADGTALPSWLTFDAATGSFSGTPTNVDVGAVSVRVTATDASNASASDVFDLAVANTNDAPVAIVDGVAVNEDATTSNLVPLLLANDTDVDAGDTRSITAINTTGAVGTVVFDIATQSLTYSADAAAQDALAAGATATDQFSYTVADAAGATAVATVAVTVTGVNDAPLLVNPIADQNASESQGFSFQVPGASFSDIDVGDTLAYSATLANGSPLPSWLSFNPATRTFTGTPGHADIGSLSVQVVATDTQGAFASDVFSISIAQTGIFGTPGNDYLVGTANNDSIFGLAGNDIIDGAAGADTLVGGAGHDLYFVDNTGDVVTELPGEGIDTVTSSVTYTLSANIEGLVLNGSAAINGTGNELDNALTGNSAANVLSGGLGNDSYYASTGDTVVETANAGNDTVVSDVSFTLGANLENLVLVGTAAINGTGNAGNNILTGNGASNVLAGGLGDDTYGVGTGDTVTEAANAGTDTVISSVTWTLGANLENLTLFGTAAINGTGNTLDNLLTGNSAANTLSGGAGNDTYFVSTGDTVTEAASAGTDTVNADVSWTLATNIENLTLLGTANINATGNTLANVLTGNAGSNTLSGGAGADTMVGGAGDDIYVRDNTGDVVTENANEGTDTVQSLVTYTLAANVENLTLTATTAINGTGNALNNVLTGGSGANVLTGLGGNDIYFIGTGDTVTEAAGGGEDLVNSSITHTLGANVEHLILTGTTALNGTGNTLNNLLRGNSGVNTLAGAAGNDVLEGGGGNDTLSDTGGANLFSGQAGTDTLTGNSGNELFIGGAGNDTLNTGAGADILAFNRGDGSDTVAVSTVKDNSVSLGGGIAYADLFFQKSGNNLVLKSAGAASAEGITFTDWYAASANRSVLNMQMIVEASADFDAGSADPLRNKKVAEFNFDGLVAAFDAARAADPGLTSWALTNALLSFHLGGSDTAALGGDLAYQQGRFGNLANVGTVGAQNVLGGSGFGSATQTFQPLSSLQEGLVRLT